MLTRKNFHRSKRCTAEQHERLLKQSLRGIIASSNVDIYLLPSMKGNNDDEKPVSDPIDSSYNFKIKENEISYPSPVPCKKRVTIFNHNRTALCA